ncbi:hypothetical protein [Paenibacillus hamazuiensis]|uniref:hypothetical protein n=1 Tax=Paenibacillus hamazuiensis TaxID=2936508 RepID=UPI00200E89E9|nr:hypothetical protein [Paenibacillus hamazuiensis]
MNLIELLFKHWYLLFIAYIVYTMIRAKRQAASGGEPKPPRGAMPPFGGGAPLGRPAKPAAAKPPAQSGRAAGPAAAPGTAARPAASAPAPAAATAEPRGAAMPPVPASAPERRPPAAAPKTRGSEAGEALPPLLAEDGSAKRQLLQGVLWAEVLGPPRAKKPFKQRNT